jgi:hypothetical protein
MYLTYILNVLATLIKYLIYIMWNILKLLIILDFKFFNKQKNFEIHPQYNIKPQPNLLQTAHLKAGNYCKDY